jgi:hypothetical protein
MIFVFLIGMGPHRYSRFQRNRNFLMPAGLAIRQGHCGLGRARDAEPLDTVLFTDVERLAHSL